MNLDRIPAEARAAVETLAAELKQQLGDNLVSLTLVGSVLSEAYSPKYSDINSVLVVQENRPETLDFLARLGLKMGRLKLAAPLLMRPAYIERSCDVFAVEWLDYQWRHHTVLGTDPFSELSFARGDVRLQCERESKSVLVRLRQGYIGSAGKPAVIGQLLAAAGRDLLPFLRAVLWLHDTERPARAAETFDKVEKMLNVSLSALAVRYAERYEKVRLTAQGAQAGFWQTCHALEELAEHIDKMEVD